MVARLLFDSVSLAQKPKSAIADNPVSNSIITRDIWNKRTNLNIADTIQQNIVTLNITMDNILTM